MSMTFSSLDVGPPESVTTKRSYTVITYPVIEGPSNDACIGKLRVLSSDALDMIYSIQFSLEERYGGHSLGISRVLSIYQYLLRPKKKPSTALKHTGKETHTTKFRRHDSSYTRLPSSFHNDFLDVKGLMPQRDDHHINPLESRVKERR